MTSRFIRFSTVLSTGLLLTACGGTGDSSNDTQSGVGSGAANGSGGPNGNGNDGPVVSGGSNSGGESGGGDGPNGECAGTDFDAELIPLDMFIMLDRSGSMEGSNWTSVTSAIHDFVDAQVQGYIGVGLGFFPTGPVACVNNADCIGGLCMGQCVGGSCKPSDYANPAVPIQPLPGAATPIKGAIAGTAPNGGTPLAGALRGALAYAAVNQTARPTHITTVVLLSDGLPDGCAPDLISDVSTAAAAGLAQGLRTFVIGIGAEQSALEEIAVAGGTAPALIIGSGSVADAFLAKLEEIRGSVQCQFQIPVPAQGTPNYDEVNVDFTPDGGSLESIPRVSSEADCGTESGYYYDNPTNPQTIILCPQSCTNIEANPGKLSVALGCESKVR